jgi:AmiR/NasT family two-component response regulator
VPAEPRNGGLEVLLLQDGHSAGADIEEILRRLGHQVRTDAARVSPEDEPDIVISIAGSDGAIPVVGERMPKHCPVVWFLAEAPDRLLRNAAYAGVVVHVLGGDRSAWPKVVEVALRPFATVHGLEGALQRRAVIERAKGVLMERHAIRERDAFELLRREARATNRRVVDVAAAVLDGHLLLHRDEIGAKGVANLN